MINFNKTLVLARGGGNSVDYSAVDGDIKKEEFVGYYLKNVTIITNLQAREEVARFRRGHFLTKDKKYKKIFFKI